MFKKKKVLIMTATGSYNLGDEIILREELAFLHGHYGEMVEFTVFTHDKKSALFQDESITWATYFPHAFWSNPFANIWYALMNIWRIAKADILIVGGGGIIFDNEDGVSFNTLLSQWYFRTKIARLAGTTIVYLGISIEVKQVKNKMMLRKLFQKGDFIIVRDEKSAGLLEALEVPCSEIHDLAFLMSPTKPAVLPGKKRIGLSFRGGFLGDNEHIIPDIYDFLVSEGYDPIFLMHTTSGDEEQNDALFIKRIMNGKTYNTTGTIQNTLSIYPTLHAVIGMRFHAAVLSCVHEIPFFLLSYGPKTEALIKLLEVEEFIIRPDQINMERITKMWHRLEEHYDARCAFMKQKHDIIRADLVKKLRTL